jgi:hypothetical protein
MVFLQVPNAAAQPLPEAGATLERTLEAVGCSGLFGWGRPVGRRWGLPLPRPLPLLGPLRTVLHPTLPPCPRLLDHLIHPEEEQRRERQAKGLRRLQVNVQVELVAPLHG